MNLKEEIIKELDFLQNHGLDRGKVEAELEMSENSIDQNLARGGTKQMLSKIRLLRRAISAEATPVGFEKRLPIGEINVTVGDYIDLMKEYNGVLKGKILNVESGVSTLLTSSGKMIENQNAVLEILEASSAVAFLEKDAETDKAYEESKKIAANLRAQQTGTGRGKARKLKKP